MKLLVLILIFSVPSFAGALSLSQCVEQGKNYGQPVGSAPIHQGCRALIQVETNHLTYRTSPSEREVVYGKKNFIFSNVYEEVGGVATWKEHIISGEQSRLEEIHAIKLDPDNREIYVLANSPKALFVFRMDQGGNVAPIRKFYSPELEDIDDFTISLTSDEIYLIEQETKTVRTFSRKADVDGRKPSNKTERQWSFSFSGLDLSMDHVCFSHEKRSLVSYDEKNRQLVLIGTRGSRKGEILKRIKEKEFGEKKVTSLLESSDGVLVRFSDGSSLEVKL